MKLLASLTPPLGEGGKANTCTIYAFEFAEAGFAALHVPKPTPPLHPIGSTYLLSLPMKSPLTYRDSTVFMS
jgi:hypothetical protein